MKKRFVKRRGRGRRYRKKFARKNTGAKSKYGNAIRCIEFLFDLVNDTVVVPNTA